MTKASSRSIRIFYCYADEDEKLKKELDTHLATLKDLANIITWDKHKILPGTPTQQEIDKHFEAADIVLLLISSDFMASDSYRKMESIRPKLEAKKVQVIPINLRFIDIIKGTWISELQMLPIGGKPVTSWNNKDKAWKEVVKGIREVVEALPTQKEGEESGSEPRVDPSAPPVTQKEGEELGDSRKRDQPSTPPPGVLLEPRPEPSRPPSLPNWRKAVILIIVALILSSTLYLLHPRSPLTSSRGSTVTATAPAAISSATYPMYGYNTLHTHYYSDKESINTRNVSDLKLDGKIIPIPSNANGLTSSPVVENGIVYIGSPNGTLYAYDSRTQKLSKIYPTQDSFTDGAPTIDVDNGTLYLAPVGTTLYALDATTLTPKWTGTVGSITYSSPIVANGMVYLGGADGYLYAFNASGCSSSPCQPQKVNLHYQIDSSPTFYNGVIYVSTRPNASPSFYAIDARKLKVLWSATLTGTKGESIGTQSTPAVDIATGMVYVGAGNYLYAFNASGCGSSTCTGTHSLQFGSGTNSSPVIDSATGVVYISSGNSIFAFDATTLHQLRSCSVGTMFGYTSPTMAQGIIYVGLEDGTFQAINASDCSQLWHYSTGGPIEASPAVVNGVVYIVSEDNKLYAFYLPGTTP